MNDPLAAKSHKLFSQKVNHICLSDNTLSRIASCEEYLSLVLGQLPPRKVDPNPKTNPNPNPNPNLGTVLVRVNCPDSPITTRKIMGLSL